MIDGKVFPIVHLHQMKNVSKGLSFYIVKPQENHGQVKYELQVVIGTTGVDIIEKAEAGCGISIHHAHGKI
jgi:hypothetical protein